jgi:hypothetical protein
MPQLISNMLLNGMLKEPSGNQEEAEHGSSSSSSSSKQKAAGWKRSCY